MLRRALESLGELHVPDQVEVELIVCENGNENAIYEAVEDARTRLSFELHFLREQTLGIAFMRNRILKEAIRRDATFLAFFDDDEVVNRDWLLNLFKTQLIYEADVVQGHLEQHFETEVSDLVRKNFPGSFSKKTGDQLDVAYTGNVLFSLRLVKEADLLFDSRLSMTGGSDSLFFMELYDLGAKIVFCKEAVATETIPASRASIEWLLSRSYRNGYVKYLIDLELNGKEAAWKNGLRYLWRSIKTVMIVKGMNVEKTSLGGFSRWKRYQLALGTFDAMRKKPFSEYQSTHGA